MQQHNDGNKNNTHTVIQIIHFSIFVLEAECKQMCCIQNPKYIFCGMIVKDTP